MPERRFLIVFWAAMCSCPLLAAPAGQIPVWEDTRLVVEAVKNFRLGAVLTPISAMQRNSSRDGLAALVQVEDALFTEPPPPHGLGDLFRWVGLTITYVNDETAMNEAVACVSCITLTFVPLHTSDEKTYLVETRCGIESVNQRLAQPVTFKIMEASWLSITPTGWIPVPAGGGGRVLGTDGAIKMAKDATRKACVEAVVANLRRIPPEAWARAPAAPARLPPAL